MADANSTSIPHTETPMLKNTEFCIMMDTFFDLANREIKERNSTDLDGMNSW